MTNDAAVVRYDPWIRYDLDTNGTPCMERILYGDYVRVEDYWALATTVAELRTELQVARAAVESKAGWEWKARAEAAERRVAELEAGAKAVVLAFETLGQSHGIVADRAAHRQCEATLVTLKSLYTLRQEKPE